MFTHQISSLCTMFKILINFFPPASAAIFPYHLINKFKLNMVACPSLHSRCFYSDDVADVPIDVSDVMHLSVVVFNERRSSRRMMMIS